MHERLRDFLAARAAQFDVLTHEAAISAQEQAAALHVPGAVVAKVLIVKERDGFVMAIVPASTEADLDRLKGLIGHGEIRLATVEEVRDVVPDCTPGMIPPFGTLYSLPSFIDQRLLLAPQVVAPAGDPCTAIRLSAAEFRRLVDATSGDFAVAEALITAGGVARRGRGRSSSGMRSRR